MINMTEFTDIYETMLGLREPVAQVDWVGNAFEEGGVCALHYEQMRAAYGRICQRLGTQEDRALETIQRELCRRMLNLGVSEHWRWC